MKRKRGPGRPKAPKRPQVWGLNLRPPEGLKEACARAAEADGRTLASWVLHVLGQAAKEHVR